MKCQRRGGTAPQVRADFGCGNGCRITSVGTGWECMDGYQRGRGGDSSSKLARDERYVVTTSWVSTVPGASLLDPWWQTRLHGCPAGDLASLGTILYVWTRRSPPPSTSEGPAADRAMA